MVIRKWNEEDTDEAETLIFMLHYGRLSAQTAAPAGALTLKGSKQIHSIYPGLEEI